MPPSNAPLTYEPRFGSRAARDLRGAGYDPAATVDLALVDGAELARGALGHPNSGIARTGEDGLQRIPLDRFLQHGDIGEAAVDRVDAVTGNEDEGNAAHGEGLGDGIDHVAIDVHVEDRRIQRAALDR